MLEKEREKHLQLFFFSKRPSKTTTISNTWVSCGSLSSNGRVGGDEKGRGWAGGEQARFPEARTLGFRTHLLWRSRT